ncbi:DUF2255 family protein, partial [Streptomyces mirabilis]|uniref:DUF2255 family protein n=1 Tax=Streptomyces mirabilis TaxID=68239 RepID=UPI0036B2B64E
MTTSYGPGSDWFRGTRARREGRIEADGVEKEVTLTDADGESEINSGVDAACRTKYGRCSANTIARTTSLVAGSTTMRLVPRGGVDAWSDVGGGGGGGRPPPPYPPPANRGYTRPPHPPVGGR